MLFFGSLAIAYLAVLFQVFINRFAGVYGFLDVSFCSFVALSAWVLAQQVSSTQRLLSMCVIALAFGLCYDLASINTTGLAVATFLMIGVGLVFSTQLLWPEGLVARLLSFTWLMFLFEALSFLLLWVWGDVHGSSFSWLMLVNAALLNGCVMSIVVPQLRGRL